MERNRHIDFVIPSEARDLHFAANCRSLASLGMTKVWRIETAIWCFMFACIFIPDFSVQAITRLEPELRARAVAVLTGRPPLGKVVALNERARQTGVELGATKSQLEAWENLVLRVRSESQETSAHAALLDCAQSFSPEVEDASPGIVPLNLVGLEPLFGPLPKIARDLAQRVSQMGLEANIAVAANPDAALLAAR